MGAGAPTVGTTAGGASEMAMGPGGGGCSPVGSGAGAPSAAAARSGDPSPPPPPAGAGSSPLKYAISASNAPSLAAREPMAPVGISRPPSALAARRVVGMPAGARTRLS